MRTVSSIIALYGSDYLGHAFKAMDPFVDEHHLWLNNAPSYGQSTAIPNPDSEDLMLDAVEGAELTKPMHVHRGYYHMECAHRGELFGLLNRGDIVVIADADEIWNPELLQAELAMLASSTHAEIKIRMMHFWRSFNHASHDVHMQIRLLRKGGEGIIFTPVSSLPDRPDIYHFGYARTVADTRYKLAVSAHAGEFKPGWFDNVFLPRRMNDVHPTCNDFWNPQPFDKTKLPEFMREHPYFDLEIIE